MMTTNFKHKNLPKLISYARERHAITQSDLARYLGYTTSQLISNFERGLCSLPIDRFSDIAKCLKLNINDLIEEYIEDERAKVMFIIKRRK